MSKRRLGRLCTALGTVCILLSLGLLLYDRSQELQAQRITQELAPALEQAIAQRAQQRREDPPPAEEEAPVQPEITLNGEVYLGLLSIPALELELPVRRDLTDRALKLSPCRYAGSVEDGGLVIAAHNYRQHFAKLSALRPGDLIRLTDADGGVHDYTVVQTETLAGDAAAEMTDGRWDLTLFTCTYGGGSRLTVRCIQAE